MGTEGGGKVVYKLGIFEATDEDTRDALARFSGKGTVERALVAMITAGILAQVQPSAISRLLHRGPWWISASRLPALITDGIEAALLDVKLEVTRKHLGE